MILDIEKILDGRSGILGPDNRDAFTHHYPEKNFVYLRESSIAPETIYQGIFTDIFHARASKFSAWGMETRAACVWDARAIELENVRIRSLHWA